MTQASVAMPASYRAAPMSAGPYDTAPRSMSTKPHIDLPTKRPVDLALCLLRALLGPLASALPLLLAVEASGLLQRGGGAAHRGRAPTGAGRLLVGGVVGDGVAEHLRHLGVEPGRVADGVVAGRVDRLAHH